MTEGHRSKRISVTVTPKVYEAIVEAADMAGLSINAYCAMSIAQNAQTMNMTRNSLLEAARQEIRETIGLQDFLPLMLEAARLERAECEAEDEVS